MAAAILSAITRVKRPFTENYQNPSAGLETRHAKTIRYSHIQWLHFCAQRSWHKYMMERHLKNIVTHTSCKHTSPDEDLEHNGTAPLSSRDCEAPVSLKIVTGYWGEISPISMETNPSVTKGKNSSLTTDLEPLIRTSSSCWPAEGDKLFVKATGSVLLSLAIFLK